MDHIKILLFGNSIMLLGTGFIAGTIGDSYTWLTGVGYILLGLGFLISLYGFFKKRK